jgi:hypothetical protein
MSVIPVVPYLPTGLAGYLVGSKIIMVRVNWLGHLILSKKNKIKR